MVKKVINIPFDSVTPKPTPKSFSQKFMEAMERNPKMVTLTFHQYLTDLSLKVIFSYKDAPKMEICADATNELIFAILCSFREDYSKLQEYKPNECKVISTDEDVDLHVEMFKVFLASPYQKIDLKSWKPYPDDPDNRWLSLRFPVNSNRFVSFSLPDYKEMFALYKYAKDNNIGNNK